MTNLIDKSYFVELEAADPEIICRNGRCTYDSDLRRYSLAFWGDQYLATLPDSKIDCLVATGPPVHEYFNLLVIYYLLKAKDIRVTGEWVSEKDLPGGPTFFRGPHQMPTDLISKRFGNDLQKLQTRCENLGGSPIEMGDAAFSFSITPDLPVAVLYWIGDEDFPAEAKVLYDRSIADLLSLDIIYALAVGVCDRIGSLEELV